MAKSIELSLEHPHKEFVSPLIVVRGDKRHTSGSAFFIAPNVAVTATHNIEGLIKIAEPRFSRGINLSEGEDYKLNVSFQILRHLWADGEDYISVHEVNHIHICKISRDITILFTEINENTPAIPCRSMIINFMPPSIGEIVKAYGYADALIGFSKDNEHLEKDIPDGYIAFGSRFSESEGDVVKLENSRWEGLRQFPFVAVNTEFLPGMSGGPLVDSEGYVCGMVTSEGVDLETGKPFAYAASLWPIGGEFIYIRGQDSPPIPFIDFFRKDGIANFEPPINSINSDKLGVEFRIYDKKIVKHSVILEYNAESFKINVEYRET